MGGPGVVALIAVKLEVALFESLHNKELVVVPFVFILVEEPSKCLFARPLHANPLQTLLLAELAWGVLHRQLSVYIVLNLLD